MKKQLNPILLSLLASSTLAPFALMAEDNADIERITVSSNFRQQQLHNIAISASVVDEQLIAQRQAQHLEQILNLAANVNFNSGASRGRFMQIRGIGERSQFSEPVNSSVGFVIDDLDMSGTAAVGTLFDVEQVEILRGPQATEFGASALAGAIKIKTAEPSATAQGKLEASVAEQNTWSLGAAYGNRINDKWQFRVSAQQYKSDGFIENTYLQRDDTDNLDELTTRLKLRYLATENTTLDLNYQYIDIDNGYDAFSLDNDSKTRSDEPGFDKQDTHAFSFKSRSELNWGQLTAILGYSASDIAYGYDVDWTYKGFHPKAYSATDFYFRDRDSLSFDLRAVSNQSSALFNSSTQWVLGFYTKSTDEDLLRQYTYNSEDFTSVYKPSNYAIYGQTDTQLTDKLHLQAGLRVDRFDMEYRDSSGFTEDKQDTIVGGKLALNYITEPATVYLSVSRGYKAGGFNPDQRVTADKRLFDPEYNWNYEAGVKGYFLDHDGFIRLAAFYMDRKDTQISDFSTLEREDGSVDFIDVIANADNGVNKGLELETGLQLTEGFYLGLSAGWLDATFERYQKADGSYVEEQELAQAPSYTFSLTSVWDLSDKLSWRIDLDGKDEYRFSDGHEVTSPFYVLANTTISYRVADWILSIWGKNLFDREYYVRGFGGFSNDPRDYFETPEAYYQIGDGQQFGLSASYQF